MAEVEVVCWVKQGGRKRVTGPRLSSITTDIHKHLGTGDSHYLHVGGEGERRREGREEERRGRGGGEEEEGRGREGGEEEEGRERGGGERVCKQHYRTLFISRQTDINTHTHAPTATQTHTLTRTHPQPHRPTHTHTHTSTATQTHTLAPCSSCQLGRLAVSGNGSAY